MNKLSLRPLSVLAALTALFSPGRADAAPFTAGNLAVVRVGEGAAALTSAAAAVFIDEYTPTGTFVQSIAIPAAAGAPMLTMAGSSTSEGGLMRSPNGVVLCFAGYSAAAGTAAVVATTAALVPREVGVVTPAGAFTVAASTATQFNTSNIRSGATDGVNNFWGCGTGSGTGVSGVNYLGTATVAAQVMGANLRWANIFNGDLYFTSGSSTPGLGVHQFTGKPVTATASSPVAIGAAGSSPYGFSINAAANILYVADDRSLASGGGIQRWNKVGAAWGLAYTLTTGATSTAGARGLVVNWSGANPVIYATTTETLNRIITITDTGVASVASTLATTGASRAFRGLAFAPVPLPRSTRFFATDALPPATSMDVSPGSFATFANGIIINNVSLRSYTVSQSPPAPGTSQDYNFSTTATMDVSTDGGATFQSLSAPATVTERVAWSAGDGASRYYDTEMLALNIQGGGLPAGIMLRESPTRASSGRTSITTIAGGYQIGSFFDIFTEVSLDAGATWSPAASAGHTDLTADPVLNGAEVAESSPNLPPVDDRYDSPGGVQATYAAGVLIKGVVQDQFTASQPPPPPGGTQVQLFGSRFTFMVSGDGGATYAPGTATASASIRVTSTQDQGATRFFDTEMLQLDLSGGNLPPGVLIRESPSKQSLGRTSIRQIGAGDYRIGSFFDVFTELSVNGGATWMPTLSAPLKLVLEKTPVPPAQTIPHFYTSANQPPLNGVLANASEPFVSCPNGVVIKTLSHRLFTQSQPLPPVGATQDKSYISNVELDVSSDGGATFSHFTAPANLTVRTTGTGGGATSTYDTEMLQMDISGGILPGGFMIRESPTKASTGKTTATPVTGGYMIGSFFDIFTEVSLDGGASWTPAACTGHADQNVDPTLILPIVSPRDVLPPPNDFHAGTGSTDAVFSSGFVIRGMKHHFFTQSQSPPALVGQSQVQAFDSQMDMEISGDGGQTFQKWRAPAAVSLRVTHTRNEGSSQIYDTEMLALNIAGGDLPAGIMLRESPTLKSQGGTAITAMPTTGTYRIHSFFDIWPELSVDGGATWSPAISSPAHLELQSHAPEAPESSPNLPSLDAEYVVINGYHATYPQGLILKDVKFDQFTLALPPPPPGASQNHSFASRVRFRISQDGGKTYREGTAPAPATMQVRSSLDSGNTRYFDTELLQLDITGGSLPAGVMLRESPSKASLGRTSIRQPGAADYRISSFFDIFTELSADGGASWQPATTGVGESVMRNPVIIPDSDGDGLPDLWELVNFGPAGAQPGDDADHDGRTNREEYTDSTNPNDPLSLIRSTVERQGQNAIVHFLAVPGRRYAVEYSTDLSPTLPWLPYCTDLEGDGPMNILVLDAFSAKRRFFRVTVEVLPP